MMETYINLMLFLPCFFLPLIPYNRTFFFYFYYIQITETSPGYKKFRRATDNENVFNFLSSQRIGIREEIEIEITLHCIRLFFRPSLPFFLAPFFTGLFLQTCFLLVKLNQTLFCCFIFSPFFLYYGQRERFQFFN